MQIIKKIRGLLKPKLKLARGTRITSFLFIVSSIVIAAGFLFAANMYYNIDTGEVVTEEIQRVTGNIRATAGLIVGGTASQNPTSGYDFETIGKSRLATTTVASGPLELTAADQELKFTGGTGNYVGLKATTTLSQTTVYTFPASDGTNNFVLTTDGNGTLSWKSVSGVGGIDTYGTPAAGQVTYFYDSDTLSGSNSLYWATSTSRLGIGTTSPSSTLHVIGDLTVTATSTLATTTIDYLSINSAYSFPTTAGTNNQVIETDGDGNLTWTTLTSGGDVNGPGSSTDNGIVRFDGITGKIIQDSTNVVIDDSGNVGIGTISPNYTLDVNGDFNVSAISTLATTTIDYLSINSAYSFPTTDGSNNYVLSTNGSGTLSWKSVSGVGGIDTYGTPAAGQVTFFYDSDTLQGSDNLFWATSTNRLGIGTNSPAYALDVVGSAQLSASLITPLISSEAALTIQSGSGDITLDPNSGIVQLGTNDYIKTSGGYEIGKSGTQILREMIPILGFDLPVQTATTTYVKISRTIENYPFSATSTGTTRVHKFVFRYAASSTSDIDCQVYTGTGVYGSPFTLPVPTSNDLGKGNASTTSAVSIPTDGTDWWLDIKTPDTSSIVRIYQVFLAAYDQVD